MSGNAPWIRVFRAKLNSILSSDAGLDRKVEFGLPDLEGRTHILRIHAKTMAVQTHTEPQSVPFSFGLDPSRAARPTFCFLSLSLSLKVKHLDSRMVVLVAQEKTPREIP